MNTGTILRDKSFDFIKGVLIFLVVWGHGIQFFLGGGNNYLHNPFYIWIYSFHMPLFIFISGYFALHTINKNFKECLYTRLYRLLIPALIWTIIRFLAINYNIVESEGFARSIYSSFRGIWFLYCLFVLYVTANIVWKSKYKYHIALFLLIIGYASYSYQPIDVLKHFQLISQWPLFVLGLVCAQYKMASFNRRYILLLFAVSVAVYSFWIYEAINNHKYLFSEKNYLIRGLILVIASFVFFVLFKFLYAKLCNTFIARLFCRLGDSTLGIYMTNSLIIFAMTGWLHLPQTNSTLLIIIYSVFITFVSYIITVLIRKRYILKKYLLGEK